MPKASRAHSTSRDDQQPYSRSAGNPDSAGRASIRRVRKEPRIYEAGNALFVRTTALTIIRDPRFKEEFERRWRGRAPTYYFDDSWEGERGRAVANFLLTEGRPRPQTEWQMVRALLDAREAFPR